MIINTTKISVFQDFLHFFKNTFHKDVPHSHYGMSQEPPQTHNKKQNNSHKKNKDQNHDNRQNMLYATGAQWIESSINAH